MPVKGLTPATAVVSLVNYSKETLVCKPTKAIEPNKITANRYKTVITTNDFRKRINDFKFIPVYVLWKVITIVRQI